MEKTQNFIENRPQELCNMCGKCCRVATSSLSFQELKSLVRQGDEYAKDFLNIFEPYQSIQDAKNVCQKTVENILSKLNSEKEDFDEKEATFYRCRYIKDDNLCGIYEKRPELCKRFPSNPWVVVPPGCGYEGWLFKKREEKKQYIRKLKEDILSYEIILKGDLPESERENILKILEKINDIIEIYSKYGAKDW
ncbi:MAG TPA: YkgJ family cysteine cluster protein [Candidatus Gastranaerophilaceae bacterium]|nr:YkgJ family cysteine cluster protein [Candidatus Gastranaerophilaceae bacterium]HPT41375.1 YkgJ family cysteine cluster protein [Candidatus Gastranaerophilaceae bacterium]